MNQKATAPSRDGNIKIIPMMKYKGVFITLSVILVLGSLFLFFTKGLNYGVDFRGGVKLIYKFQDPISDEGQLRSMLEPLSLGDTEVVRFGSTLDNSFLIKTRLIEGRDVALEIQEKLKSSFGLEKVTLLSEEIVGPKVGADLRRRGLFAVVLTWILIMIYIGWRFDFLFAPGAVVALLHDVFIGLGFFILFDKEFNLPILAAVLTLIGFSVNDTIVIYDRIRENLKKLPSSLPLSQMIDISVTETMSRTIVTSLTVLFSVLVLFFFGGGVIHDFAFFMIVGVIAGSYSTVFIASPVYLALQRLFPHLGLTRGKGKK